MRVALICRDKPGHLETRLANRAAHLDHINTSGVVEMAGPFLNTEGQMTGSLLVLNVETLEQAQAWADADPYAKAGLFDSVTVTEWKKVVG
ncbi:YciI family protein [Fuscibacter oryzae]|uniref:YciI family protein n=1 Tax=Fuscibacter oryzae TaxID=2803939 RepID=A0A8J7MV35_9RHOB|nr:YciI family protein [Fuscibacter oryzae]MBL4929033.1 YciI family protein [Fuscibacter oryzae]